MKNHFGPQTLSYAPPGQQQPHIPVRRLQSEKQRFHSGKRPPQVKAGRQPSVNKSFKSPASSVSGAANQSFFQNRHTSKVQIASPSSKNQTSKQEYLKLFGSERNYQLIRSLLDSAETTQTMPQQAQLVGLHNKKRKSGDGTVTVRTKQSRTVPMKTQVSAQHLRTEGERLDTDIQVEKALVDLSEVKTLLEVEKNGRKQHSPKLSNTPLIHNSALSCAGDYSVQTSQANMRMSAYSNLYKSSQIGAITETNGFSKLGGQTSTSFFSNGYQSGLTSNVNDLDKEQLKERLLVAEGMLKKMYNRNKELETYHKEKQGDIDELGLLKQLKQKEETVMKELEDKQNEIDDLKSEMQRLQKQVASMQTGKQGNSESNQYILFLEKRLEDQHIDTKRYLAKYIDMRQFTYTYLENQVRNQQRKKVSNSQPNNVLIYKQMIEKERKQFEEERNISQNRLQDLTNLVNRGGHNVDQVRELQQQLDARDACDAKLQSYVQELVDKNRELEQKLNS